MKYLATILALIITGCTSNESLTIALESTDKKATISVSSGNAVFKKEKILHNLSVVSTSGSSFLLKSEDGSLDSDLTFDYQKETDSWECTTCLLLGYPESWKKI